MVKESSLNAPDIPEMPPGTDRSEWLGQLLTVRPDLTRAIAELLQEEEYTEPDRGAPEPPTRVLGPIAGAGLLSCGDQIGPYVVRGLIGEGGMGTVYLAERLEPFRRTVAIKLIRARHDDRLRRRFEAERQYMAELDHPGIVRLIDGGTTPEGMPYLVMDYLRGHRLDRHCERRRLGRDDRVRLVLDVTRAIAHAHAQGVIHRDLKPSNVIVTTDGVPHVTDFGLAHAMTGEAATLTEPGVLIGTPGYIAPETLLGRPGATGPGVDVYALGAILYRLIAGRAPHEGETPLQLALLAAREDPLPLRRIDPSVPRDLETIVQRALARDPAERFATASAMADQLCLYLAGDPLTIRPPTRLDRLGKWSSRHRRPLLAWAASAGAMLLATVTLLATWNREVRREQSALRATMLDLSRAALHLIENAPPGNSNTFSFHEGMVRSFESALVGKQVPAAASFQRQVAWMHHNLARSLIDRQEPDKALPHLNRAIELLRPLPALFDDPIVQPWVRFDLFRSLTARAAALQFKPKGTLALADAAEARAMIAALVREFPDDPNWREAQARLHLLIVQVLSGLDREEEARDECRLALTLARSAVDLAPDNPVCLSSLISAHVFAGQLEIEHDQLDQAEGPLREAVVVAEHLAKVADPDDWAARNTRVFALMTLGQLLVATDRPDEARPILDEANELNESLLAQFPDNAASQLTHDALKPAILAIGQDRGH